ncbi:MAG: hypothetical protein KBE25_12075 [Laribacter sp.]|nr:hypothetical protein [Laribacter sp.]MBP9610056.1 hypothetical protein [Laribacter sp.]
MVAERNNSNAVFSSGRGGVVCSVADGRVVVSHDSDLQSVVDAKVSQLASLTAILSCAGSDHSPLTYVNDRITEEVLWLLDDLAKEISGLVSIARIEPEVGNARIGGQHE